MNYLLPLLFLILLSSCNSRTSSSEEELYDYLQGTFTSANQSEKDSTYYDVTINLAHIWKEKDEHWIYAEQALSNAIQNPYTHKIYHIRKADDERILLEPYKLKNPKKFHGAWQEPSVFNSLSPKDLIPLPGCTLYFRKEDDKYVGETRGRECPSLTTGSSYTTSQLIVTKDKLWSWSRGFNEENEQVWGKTGQGYILDKV